VAGHGINAVRDRAVVALPAEGKLPPLLYRNAEDFPDESFA